MRLPHHFASTLRVLGRAHRLSFGRVVLGLALTMGPASGVSGQGGSAMPPPRVNPASITGRDFTGVVLPSTMQDADLALSGARSFVWNDTGGVQRLLIQGDVRVQLGQFRFTAAQASVWIETLGMAADDTSTPGRPVRQIAVFFDRVSDPTAPAGVAMSGDRLLVTGVLRGGMTMRTDVVNRGRPGPGAMGGGAAFVEESEQRLARFLRELVSPGTAPDPWYPGVEAGQVLRPMVMSAPPSGPVYPAARTPSAVIEPGMARPYEPDSELARELGVLGSLMGAESPPDAPNLARDRGARPIFAQEGTVSFSTRGGEKEPIIVSVGEEETSVVITGGVVIVYRDPASIPGMPGTGALQVSAQRAVVFLDPGPVTDLGSAPASKVRGFYLEGDVVATDGKYTLRAPKVYYDLKRNKAVMVDAVFFTFDPKRQMPLYLRAKALKQEARNQFTAEKARLATTSFFDPVFSVGGSSMTVTQEERTADEPDEDGVRRTETRTYLDAQGLTLRAGGVPFFYWPRFRGEVDSIPLKEVRIESSSSGLAIKTGWDIFGLTGWERPDGVESTFLADLYFDRGPGFGTLTTWRDEEGNGRIFAYTLPIDYGRDKLTSGAKVGRDHEFRGLLLGEHTWNISELWTLMLEGSYVSDENFVDALFETYAEEGREFTNAAYLRRVEDNTMLTGMVKGSLNDFTPNEYLLQSRGYNTDKLPEIAYTRLGDTVFDYLSYSSEYRASRMQLNFTEPTARELGFDTPARARTAFGLLPDESLGDRLRDQGYTEGEVYRFDTRQEVAVPFAAGPVNITPFVTGRFTGWDRSFEEFSAEADDRVRLWYSGGVRMSTTITRVDNSVDSTFFDLHRTRHMITPSITAWAAETNIDQEDLPVYDDEVESIADGSTVRFGLKQVWQTQRGGVGRWRSVDVFTLNTDFVFSNNEAGQESPIGRFFDYRPEYSLLGDYCTVDAVWQATDTVAITGGSVYDFELNQPARFTAGGVIRHTPDFATFAEMSSINARDVTYVDFGAQYALTRKYSLLARTTYDTDEKDFQSFRFGVRRSFDSGQLVCNVRYDNIRSETSVSVMFQPAGFSPTGTDDSARLFDR